MSGLLQPFAYIFLAAEVARAIPAYGAQVHYEEALAMQEADRQGQGSEVQIAVRKGTRNYPPEDGAPLSPAEKAPQGTSTVSDALEKCMALWDTDTHMTKDEWRESCERVIKERASKPGT